MLQEDAFTTSQPQPPSQADASPIEETPGDLSGKTGETKNTAPLFLVTRKVLFKPITAASARGVSHLPSSVARLVSLAGLGAALLAPLSGCGDLSDVPCSVPTPSSSATSVSTGTPTASCTTSSGTHYVWIQSRGGWVESDDGVHPNANARGVGGDEEHSGVGDGHGGSGHGGGEGG